MLKRLGRRILLLLALTALAAPAEAVLSATGAAAATCGQGSYVWWVNASGGPGIQNYYADPTSPPPVITIPTGTVFHLTGVVESQLPITFHVSGGVFLNDTTNQLSPDITTTAADGNCVVHDQANPVTVPSAGTFTITADYYPWETGSQIRRTVGVIHAVNSAGPGPIVGYGALCLDDQGASTANYNPIQIWTCNGTSAQQWTAGGDSTLRVLGKCLDVQGGGTGNGTPVDLYDCNGTGAQIWSIHNGGWYNPQSGKCLDDPSSSTTPGTQVQIYDCNGGLNQQWTTP